MKLSFYGIFGLIKLSFSDTSFKTAVCYPPTETDLTLAGYKITDSDFFLDNKFSIILNSHSPEKQEYNLNDVITYECTKGHISAQVQAKCQPPVAGLIEGGWLFSGDCIPRLCHLPTPPENGYVVDGETTDRWVVQNDKIFMEYGKFVDFGCEPGFALFDQNKNLVKSAGEIFCQLVETERVAEKSVHSQMELDQIFHEINSGSKNEVKNDNQWILHEVKDSESLTKVDDLHLNAKNILSSPVLIIAKPTETFTCEQGVCLKPETLPFGIKDIDTVLDTIFVNEVYFNGESFEFECESGNCGGVKLTCRFIYDESQSYDGDNPGYGTWIVEGTCKPKICMLPDTMENGFIQGMGDMDLRAIQHGNEINYSCNQGYTLHKNGQVANVTNLACDLSATDNICVDNNLQNPFTCVESDCENINQSIDGSLNITVSTIAHGEEVTYECDEYHCGNATGTCNLGIYKISGGCNPNFCIVNRDLGNGVVVRDYMDGFALQNGKIVEAVCEDPTKQMVVAVNSTMSDVVCDARGQACFKEAGLVNPFECK